MKITVVLFMLLTVLGGCNREEVRLPSLDFSDISKIDLQNDVAIDSIVDHSEIIHLKSGDNLFLGKINSIIEESDFFFIVSDNQVYRFDKKGELLNKIGQKGKGPGEYIGPKKIDVDETNKQIYVMDYFGRKMLCFDYDGTFKTSFALPENYGIDGFGYWDENIIYTTMTNTVSPELYLYDIKSEKLKQISKQDREMLVGEAFVGSSFLMEDTEDLFLYHYFNDTTYTLSEGKLSPKFLVQFGDLIVKYDEVMLELNKRATVPRAQIHMMLRNKNYTLIQYGISRFNGKKSQTNLLGFYNNDLTQHAQNVNFVCKSNALFNINSKRNLLAGHGNSVLTCISAVDALALNPELKISENDNPLIIKHYLR